jgi:hypothetical protein
MSLLAPRKLYASSWDSIAQILIRDKISRWRRDIVALFIITVKDIFQRGLSSSHDNPEKLRDDLQRVARDHPIASSYVK